MFSLFDKKIWHSKSEAVKVIKKDKKTIVTNQGETEESLILFHLIRFRKKFFNICLLGDLLEGSGVEIRVYNRHKQLLAESELNAETAMAKFTNEMRYVILVIRLKPHTSFEFKKIITYFTESLEEKYLDRLTSDILVVTPSYPTNWNRYFGGFVHSRTSQYKNAGIQFDLACIHEYSAVSLYTFESIRVLKGNFALLDMILQKKVYKKILLHFFDEKYAKILDRFDLSQTQLLLWVHGPETLYSDWNYFVTPYFKQVPPVTSEQKKYFDRRDEIVKRYNEMPNVHWIFVSKWIHTHSEELIGIKFYNYSIIPNIIDEKTFSYTKKDNEQRKKIFMIRRFDNINKYAIDINVRIITSLSRRECFKDLDFYIYGEGDAYDSLIEPIKNFNNVHFVKTFLTHEDIAIAHKKCGIALFATRYDAQGVSMCEAAMSGLVIIGSALDVIKEFVPQEFNTLSPVEDYQKYADVIERIYYHPKEFDEISMATAKKMRCICSYGETIAKEIELINKTIETQKKIIPIPSGKPVLTVIIPSYNAAKYIQGTIHSLISHNRASQMEILIINDGSTDETKFVVEKTIKELSHEGQSIVRLISKENGGHGSTINVGIREAKGKYLKIVDSDDTLISSNLEKLICQLENDTADVVLCDYYDDVISEPDYSPKCFYNFMVPGQLYDMEDLCVPGYGFNIYGPILATGTFRTALLQNADFYLSEKTFYVDMEFNAYVMQACKSARYFPLFIYKYRQGAIDQSISESSYRKNYLQHEKVLMNLISFWKEWNISDGKRMYLRDKLIYPMMSSQYYILTVYFQSPKLFCDFDKKIKEFTDLYHLSLPNYIIKCRKTFGLYLLGRKLYKLIRKII